MLAPPPVKTVVRFFVSLKAPKSPNVRIAVNKAGSGRKVLRVQRLAS